MGTDIHGWVEVRKGRLPRSHRDYWEGVVKIDAIVTPNSEPFGHLFGVMNQAHFRPIAEGRGIPPDASEELTNDYEESFTGGASVFGPSFVTWAEIKVIDWGELSEQVDADLHEYVRDAAGQLDYQGKAAWSEALADATGGRKSDVQRRFPEGSEWEIDGVVYRAERRSRRGTMTREWQLLFSLMETLGTYFREKDVRLVVWFER